MAADVLAHADQLAAGVEQAGRVKAAGAGESGLHQPIGQLREQSARSSGSSGQAASRSLWTVTSSIAPLPQTPQDEVV